MIISPFPSSFRSPPEWVPTNIDGCVLWLRSDLAWKDAARTQLCTTDGDLIYVGEDKSGDGNHATQATSDYRPAFYTNQVNGHPSMRFNGTSNFLKCDSIATKYLDGNDKPFTLIAVHTLRDWVATGPMIAYASQDSQVSDIWAFGFWKNACLAVEVAKMQHEPDFTWKTATGSWVPDWPTSPNLPKIYSYITDGNTVSAYKNDYTLINAADMNVEPAIYKYLSIGCGSEDNYSWTSDFWDGDIIEILGYNRAITSEEHQRIKDYLNTESQGTGYAIY